MSTSGPLKENRKIFQRSKNTTIKMRNEMTEWFKEIVINGNK